MSKQLAPDSLLRQVGRTCGYAATALCAHFAGYFLLAQPREYWGLLLPLALWCSSLPFYLSYAVSYPFSRNSQPSPTAAATEAVRTATRQALPIIAGLAMLALVALHVAFTRTAPPPLFWAALVFFAVVPFAYGRYLIRRQEDGTTPEMRHQIVWPVLLSIALPLYAGVMFSPLPRPELATLPVLLLVAYYLISIKLRPVPFLLISLSLFGLMTLPLLIDFELPIPHLEFFLLSIAVSAYLAVFEAWRITAHIAQTSTLDSSESTGIAQPQIQRYYIPTALALTTAGLGLPLLYIFSSLGLCFFIGIALHTMGAFGTWYWAGGDSKRISRHRWVLPKTIFGYVFLAILVFDAYFPIEPTTRFFPSFVNVSFVGIFVGLAVAVFIARFAAQFAAGFESLVESIVRTRLAASILLLALSTAFAFVTLGAPDVTPELTAKSDIVFYFYIFALFMGTLTLFQGTSFTNLRLIFRKATAVLALTRLFTSLMIGLAVFLPAIFSGVQSRTALIWALPFYLAASAGFALNDYFDYERDRLDKPFRVLPRGLLQRRTALRLGVTLCLAGIGVALLFSDDPGAFTLQIIALVGSASYVLIVKWFGALKWLYTALLCSLPVVFTILLLSHPTGNWLVVTGLVLFISGREIMMDLLDVKADRLYSLKTLPIVWGLTPTRRLGVGLYAASAVPLIAWGAWSVSVPSLPAFLAVGSLLLIGIIIAGSVVTPPLYQRAVVRCGWLPMILMGLLLVF